MPKKKYSVSRPVIQQPCDPTIRLIPLTQGQVAIVDATDAEWLMQWNWCAVRTGKNKPFYAQRGVTGTPPRRTKTIYMHKEILGIGGRLKGDHIDMNTLNNRRGNLRPATSRQNVINRKLQSNNTTGYRGVTRAEDRRNKFRAQIKTDAGLQVIGFYATAEEARDAYTERAKSSFGEFIDDRNLTPQGSR